MSNKKIRISFIFYLFSIDNLVNTWYNCPVIFSERTMAMNKPLNPESKAWEFLEKYDVSKMDEGNLINALFDQGYTVVEFDRSFSGINVKRMLDHLGMVEKAASSACFTYSDKNYKLIFLSDELSDEDKLRSLACEQWYILNEYFANNPQKTAGSSDEKDAQAFAGHILSPSGTYRFLHFMKRNTYKIVLTVAAILFVAALVILH